MYVYIYTRICMCARVWSGSQSAPISYSISKGSVCWLDYWNICTALCKILQIKQSNGRESSRGQSNDSCLAGASVTRTSSICGLSQATIFRVMLVYSNSRQQNRKLSERGTLYIGVLYQLYKLWSLMPIVGFNGASSGKLGLWTMWNELFSDE